MRDKVFIVWSGKPQIAARVKSILDDKYEYLCYVGGNEDNSATNIGIGDAVIKQMRECNQAIVIFERKESTSGKIVSQNLFLELGFCLSAYGPRKVHCVRRQSDGIELPSDLSDAFVKELDGATDEEFASQIVSYFLKRQKMSIEQDKMDLINRRHEIKQMIARHYSGAGSLCSDYELAQYILFYAQAAHMYEDEAVVEEELSRFLASHISLFSPELKAAVLFARAYLSLIGSREMHEGEISIPLHVYDDYFDTCCSLPELVPDSDHDLFCKWLRLFITESENYAAMLYAKSPEVLGTPEEKEYLATARELADEALRQIGALEKEEEQDRDGILMLIRSYLYRNQYVVSDALGIGDAIDWLNKAMAARRLLVTMFGGVLDSKLYEHFQMEYNLTLCEYLLHPARAEADRSAHSDRRMKTHVGKYLDEVSRRRGAADVYIRKIEKLYGQL